jgi:hypothetical protein
VDGVSSAFVFTETPKGGATREPEQPRWALAASRKRQAFMIVTGARECNPARPALKGAGDLHLWEALPEGMNLNVAMKIKTEIRKLDVSMIVRQPVRQSKGARGASCRGRGKDERDEQHARSGKD